MKQLSVSCTVFLKVSFVSTQQNPQNASVFYIRKPQALPPPSPNVFHDVRRRVDLRRAELRCEEEAMQREKLQEDGARDQCLDKS